MTPPRSAVRRYWRVAAPLLAVAALLALAVTMGEALKEAVPRAVRHTWLLGPALVLFVIWTVAASRGWQRLIRLFVPSALTPPLWRLTQVRVEAQALNLAVPTSGVSGEVLKATATAASRGGLWQSSTAVALDGLVSTAAGVLFSLAGLSMFKAAPRLEWSAVAALIIMGAVCLLALALMPAVARRVARRPRATASVNLAKTLTALGKSGFPLQRALGVGLAWHLLERTLITGELLLYARGITVRLSVTEALFAGALMTAASLSFFFIPAQLGAAEGALALGFSSVGRSAQAGLTVAVLRRMRQLVVGVIGLVLLGTAERGQGSGGSAGASAGARSAVEGEDTKQDQAPAIEEPHADTLSTAG